MVDKDILTTRGGIIYGRWYSCLQARGVAAGLGMGEASVYVYMCVRLMQPPEGDTYNLESTQFWNLENLEQHYNIL